MNHDFVLTANYLVFCLGPILVHPLKMILGLTSFDGALRWDAGRPTLILLVPRAGGAPRWIETEAFFQFHFANGFEEDGAIVLDLTRYPDFGTVGDALRNYWHSDWSADGMAALVRLRIDLATGAVARQPSPTGNANEFPRINPHYVAARHRYVYIANNPRRSKASACSSASRVSTSKAARPSRMISRRTAIRASRCSFRRGPDGEEDDGFVVTLVFDAAEDRTQIVGLDARDLAAAPLFVARLRHHVPFSLHGTFTPRLF